MGVDLAVVCVGLLITGYAVASVRRGNVRKHFVGVSQIEVSG